MLCKMSTSCTLTPNHACCRYAFVIMCPRDQEKEVQQELNAALNAGVETLFWSVGVCSSQNIFDLYCTYSVLLCCRFRPGVTRGEDSRPAPNLVPFVVGFNNPNRCLGEDNWCSKVRQCCHHFGPYIIAYCRDQRMAVRMHPATSTLGWILATPPSGKPHGRMHPGNPGKPLSACTKAMT